MQEHTTLHRELRVEVLDCGPSARDGATDEVLNALRAQCHSSNAI